VGKTFLQTVNMAGPTLILKKQLETLTEFTATDRTSGQDARKDLDPNDPPIQTS
jgi:hypothetical protein